MKKLIVFTFVLCSLIPSLFAQTMMPLPGQTGTFTGNVRGYWFTAPTNFTIVGVRAPTDASSGNQNIAVLRLTAAPPLFPTTTNAFTQEALFQNVPGLNTLNTNISINTGDVVGILGNRADVNSYGPAGFSSNINGQSVTLARFGMQFPLSANAPMDVWQESGGSISRVEMHYIVCNQPGVQILSIGNVLCNGDSTGTATGLASGGSGAPYSYEWSTGATTATVAGLGAGTYDLTVMDVDSCAKDTTITVTEPDTITATFNNTDPLCFDSPTGTSVVGGVGGVSPYSYNWSSGATAASATLSPGTHTVTITDANNCQVDYSTTLVSPDTLTATFFNVDPACFGEPTGISIVTPSGGNAPYTVLWSNGGTLLVQGGLTPGSYTITVTDDHGCTAVESTSMSSPPAFNANITLVNDVFCEGDSNGSVSASASGGVSPYTYLWDDLNAQTTNTATELIEGHYTVLATDANNCQSSAAATVTHEHSVDLELGSDTTLFGLSGNFLAPDGFSSYLWSNGTTSKTLNVSSSGVYHLTVTDANGCTATDNVKITLINNTGVSQLDKDATIHFYPNPVEDNLYIQLQGLQTSFLQIEVLDVTGKLILSSRRGVQGDTYSQNLDLSSLSNGSYLLKLTTERGVAMRRIQRL